MHLLELRNGLGQKFERESWREGTVLQHVAITPRSKGGGLGVSLNAFSSSLTKSRPTTDCKKIRIQCSRLAFLIWEEVQNKGDFAFTFESKKLYPPTFGSSHSLIHNFLLVLFKCS